MANDRLSLTLVTLEVSTRKDSWHLEGCDSYSRAGLGNQHIDVAVVIHRDKQTLRVGIA
jgi:hypothetical protein